MNRFFYTFVSFLTLFCVAAGASCTDTVTNLDTSDETDGAT